MIAAMKRLSICILLLLCSSGFAFTQDNGEEDEIHEQFMDAHNKSKAIHDSLATYDKKELTKYGTAGLETTTAFYDGKNLKKLQVLSWNKLGKHILDFYFDEGEMIFAFDQQEITPRDETGNILEDSDNPTVKPEMVENRYYYHNGELLFWLDKNQNTGDLKKDNNAQILEDILSLMEEKLAELQ